MKYDEYTPTTWLRECNEFAKEYSAQIFKFVGQSARKISNELEDDEKLGREIYKLFLGSRQAILNTITDDLLGW